MSDRLTLARYAVEGSTRWYSSRQAAVDSLPCAERESARVQMRCDTYCVGDQVEVDAYGRWRLGRVTHLKRVRVVVQFQRNRQGDLACGSFYAARIRPRGEGSWVQS